MATLNIGGNRVKIDDSFLTMSPEQQSAAVEEIAKSLSSTQPEGVTDRSLADETGAQQRKFWEKPEVQPAPNNLMTSTAATLNGIVNGIPVLGPAVQNVSDAMIGTGAQLTGGNYGETVRGLQDRRAQLAQAAPIANLAGNIGGAVATGGVLGSGAAGANALGLTGSTGTRVLNSGLSTLGLTQADNMVRGQAPVEALQNAVGPSLISAAIPGATELIKRGGRYLGDEVVRPIATAFNRENEVTRRIGAARQQGLTNPTGDVLTSADEAVARQANIPVVNADRGGSPLQTLARTASNISPETDASLKRLTQERFEGQGGRAVTFIQRLMNGATDDLALQEALDQGARAANDPAYRRAYNSPAARAVWNPRINQLMQSDIFRSAIQTAESAGTNEAAIRGTRAIRNPFVFRPDGTVTLRQMSDGSRALPNLEFWDIVQRNLRRVATTAQRNGDDYTYSQADQLRRALNGELDTAVPAFNEARRGAYEFFQAESALDAGRQFARTPREIPEAQRAFRRFTQADRDAFSVGYASDLIDTIKSSRDRVNVINQVFGSQARREMNELALGPQRARELESYVRVEGILDQLRTAVGGNSSTAKQLIAAGVIGGAGGYWQSGGNMQSALSAAGLAAAGRRGLQMMGKKVDDRVMQRIGEVLASGDPQLLQRAIQNASMSQAHRDALEAIQRGIELAAKGGVIGSGAANQMAAQ